MGWAIALHGGAGDIPYSLPPERRLPREEALRHCLQIGVKALKSNMPPLDVVELVVRELENIPHFNAGRGSVLTNKGTVEMEASIMDGNTMKCGAVSGLTTVVNAVSLARLVMDHTPHIYLAFDGAEEFARQQGVETSDSSHFITPELQPPFQSKSFTMILTLYQTFLLKELSISIFIFFITHFILALLSKNNHRKLPPGPKGYPIVGALPLMGTMPHLTLFKMSQKYGPIMYLKMGSNNMVVASSPSSAKAFLKTLDQNFSNRPSNAGATHLAYDSQDMVFADYGSRWKLLRKLSNLHMLGGKALEDWSEIREYEMGHMIHTMYDSSKKNEPIVLPEMLTYAMANMIGQIILSRRVFETKGYESNEFKDMVVELMTTAGYFNIGDFIPILAWLDLQGIERGMKSLHKKFDVLLTKMIEDHVASSHKNPRVKPDFLDTLIAQSKQDSDGGDKLTLTNIKAVLLNLFTAGTDTSSSIIEWALAEMLKNPNTMKRAHEEMEKVIGKERRLQESDIQNLPYLQAICKETFRKHPSTPLNLPRVSSEACEVNGYYIPKNTRLSVNIWAIGRDPNVWENPLEFNPDRFLSGENAKIDPRGNDFELIPFGAGRRICAGTRMGIVLVQYILGTLVHSFDWKLPNGIVELDMDESFGLALQKKVPLSVVVSPRLTPSAYIP